MTDNNVVSLFGNNDLEKLKKPNGGIRKSVGDKTDIIISNNLEIPHSSWTRDNMIGAIASNVYTGSGSSIFVKQSVRHEDHYLLTELMGFVERSLNNGLKVRNLYCKWEGNGLFVFYMRDDSKCAKIRVELELCNDNSTDISFFHIDKKSGDVNKPFAKIMDAELGLG